VLFISYSIIERYLDILSFLTANQQLTLPELVDKCALPEKVVKNFLSLLTNQGVVKRKQTGKRDAYKITETGKKLRGSFYELIVPVDVEIIEDCMSYCV